jgi:glycosyltransferase involved in cell wall biosynthesis
VIGSVLPHKGVHVAVEAFREISPDRALLEIRGPDTASPGYVREIRRRASAAVSFFGAFPEDAKEETLSGLDVLLVPSVGLESYGLAAREALRRGVPVIASRRGALSELFSEGAEPAGALFEPGNAEELRRWIERIADDRSILTRWKSAIGSVKGMDEHARVIEAIYDEVLAR